MNYKIETIPRFEKDVKKLKKKFPKIKSDLVNFVNQLLLNPKMGIDLGENIFKVRIQNSSIPIGKSGGFRIIYYHIDTNENLYLMSIYSKNELENIDDKIILQILKENGLLE